MKIRLVFAKMVNKIKPSILKKQGSESENEMMMNVLKWVA